MAVAALLFVLCGNKVFAQNQTTLAKVKVAYSMSINISEDDSIEIANAIAEVLEEELLVRAEAGRYIQNLLPDTAKDPECLSQKDCLLNAARKVHSDKLLLLVIVGIADEIKIETTIINPTTKEVERKAAVNIYSNNTSPKKQLAGKSRLFLSNTPVRPTISSPEQVAKDVATSKDNNSSGSSDAVDVKSPGRHMNKKTWFALGAAGTTALVWAGHGLLGNSNGRSKDTQRNYDLAFGATTALFLGAAGVFYLTSGSSDKGQAQASLLFSITPTHGLAGLGGTF